MTTLRQAKQVVKHAVPKAEQDWVYLIHHFHTPSKASAMEVPHHCYLFTDRNLKGKRFEQQHVKDGRVYQHVLRMKNLDSPPEKVYDHLNNAFKVVVRKIGNKEYPVIDGPVRLRDVKWSAQDR